jgi:hypothetical protein
MMTIDLSPTRDFPVASRSPSVCDVTVVELDSFAFYTVRRFDVATHETLGAYLHRAEEAEDEAFSQSAVKSVPRSWRDL